MKFIYVGKGAQMLGLPATDLDDATLSDDQKRLLEFGVNAGLYKADTGTAPKPAPKATKSTASSEDTGAA